MTVHRVDPETRVCSCGATVAGTIYVHTLRDDDMNELEREAVRKLRRIFVALEESGSCLDVIVRAAIEREKL